MARPAPGRGGFRPWMALVPLAFFGLALVFLWSLAREAPDALPSTLIGRPAPALALAPFRDGEDPPGAAELRAPGPKIVNFWASWCAPCRIEHPVLMALAAEGVPILGVNYKDRPEDARAFLAELGDPFARIGADSGRNAIDWGVYGVPESFVLDGEGRVLLRFAGPLTPEIVAARIRPLLAR